jgi:hypothetical protein
MTKRLQFLAHLRIAGDVIVETKSVGLLILSTSLLQENPESKKAHI